MSPTFVPGLLHVGEVASIVAALVWSFSITLYAKYGQHVDSIVLNINKNLVAGICLVLTAVAMHIPWPQAWSQLPLLGLSGIIGIAIGDTLFFLALLRIGANLTSALQCLAPLLAALLAVWFLDEGMTPMETVGMVITVLAVSLVVLFSKKSSPSPEVNTRHIFFSGVALAIASAACHAIGIVMSRHSLQHVDVVYGTLARLIPAFAALTLWHRRKSRGSANRVALWASKRQGVYLTLAAFLGTYLGLILMSLSTKYTKAGVGTALSSTYPIWVIPIARVVTQERSNWIGAVGTIVAVVGIIIMLLGR